MCAFTKASKYGGPINFNLAENRPANVKPCEHSDFRLSANEMVNQFVNMKFRYRKRLKNMSKFSRDARRFYCANDCAYIFDISFLEAMVKAIRENEDDKLSKDGCMMLFQGIRDEPEDEANCTLGRPTIIAAAYAETADGSALQHVPLTYQGPKDAKATRYDAAEHPGDGTSIASKSFLNIERHDTENDLDEEARKEEETETKQSEMPIPENEEPVVLERLGWNAFRIRTTIDKHKVDKWA